MWKKLISHLNERHRAGVGVGVEVGLAVEIRVGRELNEIMWEKIW